MPFKLKLSQVNIMPITLFLYSSYLTLNSAGRMAIKHA